MPKKRQGESFLNKDAWTPIPEFEGYSINPLGQVRHDSNERIMRPRLNQQGVPYVGLMRNERRFIEGEYVIVGRQLTRSLPRLVAETFLSPPSDIFNTPIQLDGDPLNCRVDNIMWRPRWYAVKYKRQFGARYHQSIDRPILAIENRERFSNSFEAGLRFGLLEEEVVQSIRNNTPAWPTYQTFELLEMA